jgi:hypothetical protein
MKASVILLFVLSIFTLSACQEEDDTTPEGVSISGVVVNEAGQPINGAVVTIGVQSATTDAQGNYSISGVSTTEIQVSAEALGYFKAYRNGENRDESVVKIDIMMITKADMGTINSEAGGSVSDGSITVTATAGAFTNADGSAYSGDVHVAGRVIKDNDANMGNLMPGGDYTATNNEGQEGFMQTFGFTATEFTDPSGNPVTLVPGQVTVTFTAASTPEDAQLWVFNPVAGSWSYAGELVVSGNEVIMTVTGGVYHNCDAFRTTTAYIEGIVTDCDGNPIVTQVKLDNGYARYTTATNGNGLFRVRVLMAVDGPSYIVSAAGVTLTAPNQGAQTVNVTIEVNPETGQLCNPIVQGSYVTFGSDSPMGFAVGVTCQIDQDDYYTLKAYQSFAEATVVVAFAAEPTEGSYSVSEYGAALTGTNAWIIGDDAIGEGWNSIGGGQIVVSIVSGKVSVAFSGIPVVSDGEVSSTMTGNITCGN